MHEEGMAARKIAYFDSKIFDPLRHCLENWDWSPKGDYGRYLRKVPVGRTPDYTYLIYLPVNELRRISFASETTGYPMTEIYNLWGTLLEPILENYIVKLTEIDNPVIVQADIARMRPMIGNTFMHTDTRYHQRYSRRYNIAITTNNDCWLYHYSYDLENGGIRDHINEGELWELNNKIPHAALNYGSTWRTHLIIDLMPRNYWERMCERYDPYAKVPNPQGKNHTYDYDLNGNLIHEPLFDDLPHCFPARTSV